MYKRFIRPIFFLFDPESVHHFTFKLIKLTAKFPFVSGYRRKRYLIDHPSLKREIFGLTFNNPVGVAAGFDKNGKILEELEDYGFGFVEIGTVTPEPQAGNPRPRLFRLKDDQGIINRMGFNNDGAQVIANRLKGKKVNIIVGGNIGKNNKTSTEESIPDFVADFEALHPYVDYFVVNVSCPNVGNDAKLQDKDFLIRLLNTLKELNATKEVQRPILLKIAPDLNDQQLDEIIEVVAGSKIDGVIATNTSTSRDNLREPEISLQKIGNGGLSGRPILAKSNRVIRYLAEKSNKSFPIIGVGGIHSADDALQKLEAGADLVQVYTGFIYEGPNLVRDINRAIIKHAETH